MTLIYKKKICVLRNSKASWVVTAVYSLTSLVLKLHSPFRGFVYRPTKMSPSVIFGLYGYREVSGTFTNVSGQ